MMDSRDQASIQAPAPLTEGNECSRFQQLHALEIKDVKRSFTHFVKQNGLEKVRQYHDQLEVVFGKMIGLPRHYCCSLWGIFFILKSINFESLKVSFRGENPDLLKQLLHLGCSLQFPNDDSSNLSSEAMATAIIQATIPESTSDSRPPELQLSAEIVQAGLCAEYKKSECIVKPNLNLLRDWANEWSIATHKAPYTSIIGPTMIGKTRLVLELAKHVCVVYICIRPSTSTGQPPRSSLADILLPNQQLDLHLHYSRFLAAILEAVADFFSRAEVCGRNSKDQLAAWLEHSFQKDNTRPPEKFSSDVRTKMEALPGKTAAALVAEAADKMNESIKFIPGEDFKLLLAIDEARNLLVNEDQNLKITYFRVFRRVLSQIPESKGFFAVFTDTTSLVANFSPSSDKDPSLRAVKPPPKLFPPIYKLSTMDLMAKPIPKSWKELLSPLRLFSYGSPFYSLYFERLTPQTAISKTMVIATTKLLCNTEIPSAQDLSEHQIFALLGSTIQTRPTCSEMNSALTSSHAAHCMYITSPRDRIIGHYPPQFVYASAANKLLASDEMMVGCINGLATAMQNGLISHGDAGEMVTRIILLRAMHKTKKIVCNGEDSIPYGYSVRLEDFLETLTGKKSPTVNRPPPKKKPRTGKKLLTEEKPEQFDLGPISTVYQTRLLQHGQIFFNHFTPIKYTPNATKFMGLLYRGLAVQCKPGQPGLDALFPIYLTPKSKSPDSDKLNSKNISFCGIQTKNQKGSVDWTNSHKWSKSYTGIQGIENPYLILLFSLRSEGKRQTPPWQEPLDIEDKQRAYLQFLGLDCIACLTPEIRTALRRLLNSWPADVLLLHKPNPKTMPDEDTLEWVRCVNPKFYDSDN